MSKFFKLLGNASKIFKYVNIFAHVSNGLNVACVALDSASKELYKTNATFKYLSTLESVLSFMLTVKEAVDSFTEIFGILPVVAEKRSEEDDAQKELDEINGKIKELL